MTGREEPAEIVLGQLQKLAQGSEVGKSWKRRGRGSEEGGGLMRLKGGRQRAWTLAPPTPEFPVRREKVYENCFFEQRDVFRKVPNLGEKGAKGTPTGGWDDLRNQLPPALQATFPLEEQGAELAQPIVTAVAANAHQFFKESGAVQVATCLVWRWAASRLAVNWARRSSWVGFIESLG